MHLLKTNKLKLLFITLSSLTFPQQLFKLYRSRHQTAFELIVVSSFKAMVVFVVLQVHLKCIISFKKRNHTIFLSTRIIVDFEFVQYIIRPTLCDGDFACLCLFALRSHAALVGSSSGRRKHSVLEE